MEKVQFLEEEKKIFFNECPLPGYKTKLTRIQLLIKEDINCCIAAFFMSIRVPFHSNAPKSHTVETSNAVERTPQCNAVLVGES